MLTPCALEELRMAVHHRPDMYSHAYMGRKRHVCATLIARRRLLTSVLSGFGPQLLNGGPAGLFGGLLFAWGGALLQALVMAEMASM